MIKPYTEVSLPEKEIIGKTNAYDNHIYTFDIETTSFFELDGCLYRNIEYDTIKESDKERIIYHSTMYIWQLGIDDHVYYGRTWRELKEFLSYIEDYIPEKKYFFIHNLSFEFQYLSGEFNMKNVISRKSRKVMRAELADYNIVLKCTYMMSNVALEDLPGIYQLPVEKQVGKLDYSIIRHSNTPLTEKELEYCEYDCLVVYYYIKRELETYKELSKLPMTSTGKVRRELKELVMNDLSYRNQTRKAINTDPHVYNLLVEAFLGGYTHSNWVWTNEVLKDIDSYDETSEYPYIMVTHRFPSGTFKKCKLEKAEDMIRNFAYLLVVKFKNVKTKYYNDIISMSKCRNIRGGRYDNGRIISADEFEITCTDVDFSLYLAAYECEYEILESYRTTYNYLPKKLINFILEKYINKTKYKNVEGKELEYQLEKAKFNSIYGMTVTNNIKDEVKYSNTSGWSEEQLSNEDIINMLESEKKQGFLSFSTGVWVTAYARNNLLRNVLALDPYVVYCDTDSIKLVQGYKKEVIDNYNKFVEKKIQAVSKRLEIPLEKYQPLDVKGIPHLLGVFDCETRKGDKYTYQEFITQGAKKYAFKQGDKIGITVAGVPKKNGAKCLKDLNEFRDGLVFPHELTNKNTLVYNDNMNPILLYDFMGTPLYVTDHKGCCFIPTTYTLGKALDYCHLVSDDSSPRARFKI